MVLSFSTILTLLLELHGTLSDNDRSLKGLLAMALEKGALTLDEVRSILAPHEGSLRPSRGFGEFMIDLDEALIFTNEVHVDKLASQIDRWT